MISFAERRRFLWILFLIGLALIAVVANATTLARLSLAELASRSGAIVRARCLSSESRFENGEIWTFTEFEVSDSPKGLVPRFITVRTLGGRANGFISVVQGVPRFAPGEEAYLFLVPSRGATFQLFGWAQGTFRIERDPRTGRESVTWDSAALSVFDPATRTFRRDGVRRLPLGRFLERLRTALGEASSE
jgi:hypothetical protein